MSGDLLRCVIWVRSGQVRSHNHTT